MEKKILTKYERNLNETWTIYCIYCLKLYFFYWKIYDLKKLQIFTSSHRNTPWNILKYSQFSRNASVFLLNFQKPTQRPLPRLLYHRPAFLGHCTPKLMHLSDSDSRSVGFRQNNFALGIIVPFAKKRLVCPAHLAIIPLAKISENIKQLSYFWQIYNLVKK